MARADRAGARRDGGGDRRRGRAARRHPLGFALGPPTESCGTCAWLYEGGRGTAVARCRQSAPANGDGARTRAQPPGLRALGAARRLPHLRRVLPRGLPFRDRVDARSGRLAGARFDRAPRRAASRFAAEGSRCAALTGGRDRRGEQLHVRDLREPPAALPRVRGRRPALPGRAPAGRAERDAAARAMSHARHG